MHRERAVGIGNRTDGVIQQLLLDVEQRHAPAVGEEAFCGRKPMPRAAPVTNATFGGEDVIKVPLCRHLPVVCI